MAAKKRQQRTRIIGKPSGITLDHIGPRPCRNAVLEGSGTGATDSYTYMLDHFHIGICLTNSAAEQGALVCADWYVRAMGHMTIRRAFRVHRYPRSRRSAPSVQSVGPEAWIPNRRSDILTVFSQGEVTEDPWNIRETIATVQ